ncbi:PREDICTED: uncharacterized protein LOC109242218 [Nicotiana attenuata]|uniref:uncharacterized protein LOC109242218 n=1 Tax=Nicotiana attenuata TaxID=49451 RepID=UPI0009058611|nr:PREDICTED: uncharacterized protein LOC109242218 [Nicotiana attenuata]
MECVTTVGYSLVLNGGLTRPFPAKRGIRQGDPMSPYLFVIAMEYLQREMNQLTMQKEFKFHPKCKKLGETFKRFSNASGLQHIKEQLIEYTGYETGSIPFKYLGVPLSARKLNIHQCLPLIEKITERVRCWSSRMLSYSGRVQLIKLVLFGIQTYWAQIFLLPKKIMKMIETICRTFLWIVSTEYSRKALIAWDRICQPKATGGLDVKIWNKAALLKYLWALAMKKDTLWIKWAHIYYIKNRPIEEINTPKNAAWVVRKIIEAKDEIQKLRTVQNSLINTLDSFVKQGKFQIHTATASIP